MTRLLALLLLAAACTPASTPASHVASPQVGHDVTTTTPDEATSPTLRTPGPASVPQVSRTLTRPPVAPVRTPSARRAMWDRLVACEAPGRGWRYGAPDVGVDPGYDYEGGPNFTRSTWAAYRLPGMPVHAYDATLAQQIAVAERVLADQGPGAWPVCGPRVGLR